MREAPQGMRGNGHGPYGHELPFVQAVVTPQAIEQFIKATDFDDFIPMLLFNSVQESTDWAQCYSKCKKHGLDKWAEYFMRIAKARCAVNAHRAKLASQTLIGVAVPEFYDGRTTKRPEKQPSPNI